MTLFAGDDEMRYRDERYPLQAELTLDASYRLAHLPLVNPTHPDVIHRHDGADYERGRYDRERISLVAPVPYRHLESSDIYNRALAELQASPLAKKIAWDVCEQRKDLLHLTICGHLNANRTHREIDAGIAAIRSHQAFRVRLGGPWIGARNNGRLYLPVYPERTEGGDPLLMLQRSLNRPETRLYLVGLWNLTDHLDAAETALLGRFIDRYRQETFGEFQVEELHLTSTHDDLVLSGRIRNAITLQPKPVR